MSDLIRDEMAVNRSSAEILSNRGYPAPSRTHHVQKAVTGVSRNDSVQISAQARLRSAALDGRANKAAALEARPRISPERLERIKRFYAAGNMRPNPQAIARHLWNERHGL